MCSELIERIRRKRPVNGAAKASFTNVGASQTKFDFLFYVWT